MQSEYKHHFSSVLKRLDKGFSELVRSSGYNKKSERIKILSELIREQLQNENINHTTRKTR
jgi:endonuclease III-like uncharacterized protein